MAEGWGRRARRGFTLVEMLLVVALFVVPLAISVATHTPAAATWQTASRAPTGLAPDPASVTAARKLARPPRGLKLLGPAPAAMAKRAARYHAQLLIEAADRALYTAKRRGRNRVDANGPTLVSTSEPAPRAVYEPPPLVA